MPYSTAMRIAPRFIESYPKNRNCMTAKAKFIITRKGFIPPLPFRVIFSFNNTEQFAEHTLLEFIYAIPLKYSFTYIFICTKNS